MGPPRSEEEDTRRGLCPSFPAPSSLFLSLSLSLCPGRAQNNRYSAVARPPTKLPCFPPLPPPLPRCVSLSLCVSPASLACVSDVSLLSSVRGGASPPACCSRSAESRVGALEVLFCHLYELAL